MIDGRFRVNALPSVLDAAQVEVRNGAIKMLGVGAGVGVAVLSFLGFVFFIVGSNAGVPFLFFFLFVGLFSGLFFLISQVQKYRAANRKIGFARELVMSLVEDFSPFHKLSMYVDTSSYQEGGKQYWSGKSLHGNNKYRYEDAWFRLKFYLSDGTAVRVVRRADVKTRKGVVMRHKRRIYLKISPSHTIFGEGPFVGTEDLERMIRIAVAEKFHDPPEQLTVRRKGPGDSISLKITQLDAPILGQEVYVLIEAVILFLRMST